MAAGLVGLQLELVDKVDFTSMIAMVAPILLGAQTSLSRLNQDERNAARYAISYEHLKRLSGKVDDVRREAANGHSGPVQEFIRDVNRIISVKHSQWRSQLNEATAKTAG